MNSEGVKKVALCADVACLQYPESLGLADENLQAQSWLCTFSAGDEARRVLKRDKTIDEVWVVSSEDVAPINLAASLKRDRPERFVGLVSLEETGSLRSRIHAAEIDESFDRQAFIARYSARKNRALVGGPQVAPYAGVGFLFPVVSGSGGAGKSSVAVLSALIAQRWGNRTLLLDFDLQFGDMAELLGVNNPTRIEDVIQNPSRFDQLNPQDSMPALLACPARMEEVELYVEHLPWLLDRAKQSFDVIVCNTGASWSEHHAILLERSSKALFLIDQRTSSLRACKRALDLCVRCGIAVNPFLFALNRCSKKSTLSSIDASFVLQGAPVLEMRDGGSEVEGLLSVGSASDLFDAHNELCVSLELLLAEILPRKEVIERGSDSTQFQGWPRFRGKLLGKGR